jgi:pimeloyl-ACP methyl ester carboxylesterase
MPPAKPKSGANRRPPQPAMTVPSEDVDPVWLAKAVGLTLLAAIVCAWITVCLLVYFGSWQLVLHPAHTVTGTPATLGLPFEPVHFDSAETGQPRLTGWWIPAGPSARYPAFTILYLHNGSGTLSDTLPTLALLHAQGFQVFAIDYRGFGASDLSAHPSESTMTRDTAAAFEYLTVARHIDARTIIPYGAGLGAALAVDLALQHSGMPAVVVDNPNPDTAATALAAQPSHLIPTRLLFHDRFDLATPLAMLATPKMLIAGGRNAAEGGGVGAVQRLFLHAARPSFSISLKGDDDANYAAALTRFFDQYLAERPAGL